MRWKWPQIHEQFDIKITTNTEVQMAFNTIKLFLMQFKFSEKVKDLWK